MWEVIVSCLTFSCWGVEVKMGVDMEFFIYYLKKKGESSTERQCGGMVCLKKQFVSEFSHITVHSYLNIIYFNA